MKKLCDKVTFTKEDLKRTGGETLLAYAEAPLMISVKSHSISNMIAFSSIHALLERREELQNKLKSVKYNLNIRGQDVFENIEYLDLESRLSEVNLLLDTLDLNSLKPEQIE